MNALDKIISITEHHQELFNYNTQTHTNTTTFTHRHESGYRGHPFRVSGIFPLTCHQGSVQQFPWYLIFFNSIFVVNTDARSMGSSRTGGMTTDSDMYDTGEDEILEACVRTATKPSSRPPRERKRSRSQRKSCKWTSLICIIHAFLEYLFSYTWNLRVYFFFSNCW